MNETSELEKCSAAAHCAPLAAGNTELLIGRENRTTLNSNHKSSSVYKRMSNICKCVICCVKLIVIQNGHQFFNVRAISDTARMT